MDKVRWEPGDSHLIDVLNGHARVRYCEFLNWKTKVDDGRYRIRRTNYHPAQITYLTLKGELEGVIKNHNESLAETAGV